MYVENDYNCVTKKKWSISSMFLYTWPVPGLEQSTIEFEQSLKADLTHCLGSVLVFGKMVLARRRQFRLGLRLRLLAVPCDEDCFATVLVF